MYKLKIKGERESIYLKDETGMSIKKMYDDDKIPNDTHIKTLEWSGEKSSISSIFKERAESSASENSTYSFEDSNNEWKAYRKGEQSKSIETRAKDMAWFNLVRQCFMGDRPASDETLKKVEEIQKQFFTENHFNLLTDPALYLPLFPKQGGSVLLSGVIVSAMSKDYQYAKYKS